MSQIPQDIGDGVFDCAPAFRLILAGEHLHISDAVQLLNTIAHRAETPLQTSEPQERINGVWRPATPENCPHFWIPRAYSIPSEVQTLSVDVNVIEDDDDEAMDEARMDEILDEEYYRTGHFWSNSQRARLQGITLSAAQEQVREERAAQCVVENIQPLDDEVEDFIQAKAAFGEIGSDADRETVDADDLDALFAKIDEVLEDE